MDILKPSADPFSVAPADVLARVFRTEEGDPHDEQVPRLRALAAAILHQPRALGRQRLPVPFDRPQIRLEARIVAVADSFSAMTAERPYRGRRPTSSATSPTTGIHESRTPNEACRTTGDVFGCHGATDRTPLIGPPPMRVG